MKSEEVKTVAGCDVAYKNKVVKGVIAVFYFPELKIKEIATSSVTVQLEFPYIPGLLSFREAPVLLEAVKKLKEEPDVFFFDGHGIAHPERIGLATYIGKILNKPTIGCAKNKLFGNTSGAPNIKGGYGFLKDESGEVIGSVLRTRKDVKPVFVSVGYEIGLQAAIELTMSCCKGYRIPEPLRTAHSLAKGEMR